MFGSWVLTEIWIIDLSSALVGMLLSSSKSFPLSKEVIVIGTALCYSHQLCCLLYYLGKINSGIYMYQFTLKPLHFCFRMCLWFRIWTKILADQRIWRKKGTDRRICIPLFTPLIDLHVCLWLLPVRVTERISISTGGKMELIRTWKASFWLTRKDLAGLCNIHNAVSNSQEHQGDTTMKLYDSKTIVIFLIRK